MTNESPIQPHPSSNAPIETISTRQSSDKRQPTLYGPWARGPAKSPDYPDLYSKTLYITKAVCFVPDDKWPFPKSFAKPQENPSDRSLVQILYDKFVGFGPPPQSLEGRPTSIYLDYTTENFPLIYVWWNGTWTKYYEDIVLSRDPTSNVKLVLHPVFPSNANKTYIGSLENGGIGWINFNPNNSAGYSVLRNICQFREHFAKGIADDMKNLVDTPSALRRKEAEIQRRLALVSDPTNPSKRRHEGDLFEDEPTKRLKRLSLSVDPNANGVKDDAMGADTYEEASPERRSQSIARNDETLALGIDIAQIIEGRLREKVNRELEDAKEEIRRLKSDLNARNAGHASLQGKLTRQANELETARSALKKQIAHNNVIKADLDKARADYSSQKKKVEDFFSTFNKPESADRG